MKAHFKVTIAILMILIVWIVFLPAPPVQASMPSISASDVQVQVGEEFVIQVNVRSSSAPILLFHVRAIPESGVSVHSQSVSRLLPADSSTRVILSGRGLSLGFHRVVIEADFSNESLIPPNFDFVSTEIVVEVKEAAASTRSRFEVRSVSFLPERVDITKPFTMNLNMRNIGNAAARNIEATFDGGENFIVTTLTNRVHIPFVDINQDFIVSFDVRARETHKSNEASVTLSFAEQTQTEQLNLTLPERPILPRMTPPALKLDSFELTQNETGNLDLALKISNLGEIAAQNIRLNIDGGDRVFPLAVGNTSRIRSIAGGSFAQFNYSLSTKGELVNQSLSIQMLYEDDEGKSYDVTDRIFISSNLEPALKIAGFRVRPQGVEGKFLLTLDLQNKGQSVARDITLRFTGTQAFPLNESNLVNIPNIEKEKAYELSLTMKASQTDKIIAIPVEIKYVSTGGYEHSITETITLTAESIGIVVEEEEEVKRGTPRVMLERHKLSEERLFAGSTFTLSLFIRNNAEINVENIKISLGSIQVTGTGTTGGGGGTVFSPLDGSSSSFFVEKIDAKAELVKEVMLFVDPNAAAMTYTLPIVIEFEDDKGNTFSVNETVHIPVLQETRVQILSVNVPSHGSVGEALPVSMEFANTGRIPLNNVFVEVRGEFTKENASYFLPRLEIGMSDFFQGMIFPDLEGPLSGTIVLTYLDALNEEVQIEHPFQIEVGPAFEMPVDVPIEEPQEGGFLSAFSIPLIAGIIVGGLILIAVSVLIVKKMRKKRNDDFFAENT